MTDNSSYIGKLGQRVLDTIVAALQIVVGTILKVLWLPIEKFYDYMADKIEDHILRHPFPGEREFARMGGDVSYFQNIRNDAAKDRGSVSLASILAMAGGALVGLIMAPIDIIKIPIQRILMRRMKVNFITTDEAVAAYFRGIIGTPHLQDLGAAEGYNVNEIEIKKKIHKALLGIDQIREFTLRGWISTDEATDHLSKFGFTKDESDLIKKSFKFIPSAPDLVRMAVREAFTPNIVDKYKLHSDFPPNFAKYAAQIGLSEEWAKHYWAAHWELPSISMAYEMLHRGVITRSDLELLLKTQDVMPFWRDKLIEVSYRPYTRVDVRRMYQTGTLTKEDVYQSYLDLGYDKEKAEKMTDFTVSYATETERDLTKAEIIDGFKKNIVTEKETTDFLVLMGYDPDEAAFYLQRAIFDIEKSERTTLISNIKTRFEKGAITENEARERLAEGNIPSTEVETLIELWKLTRGSAVSTPSITDLTKLLRAEIITQEQWEEEMVNKGYAKKYIEMYVEQLAIPEKEAIKVTLPGLKDLADFYKADIITYEEWEAEMANKGYAEKYITMYGKQLTKPEES